MKKLTQARVNRFLYGPHMRAQMDAMLNGRPARTRVIRTPEVIAALLFNENKMAEHYILAHSDNAPTCVIMDRLTHRHFKFRIAAEAVYELEKRLWVSGIRTSGNAFLSLTPCGIEEIRKIFKANEAGEQSLAA